MYSVYVLDELMRLKLERRAWKAMVVGLRLYSLQEASLATISGTVAFLSWVSRYLRQQLLGETANGQLAGFTAYYRCFDRCRQYF